MADQLATGIQWVVDDSTGAITGYRRKIAGVDTAFSLDADAIQSSVSGAKVALGHMGRRVSILSNSYATPFGGGFFYDFIAASSGALIADTIGGVGGNTTAMMLARVDSIPTTTDICLIHEAPNDSAASVTPGNHYRNLESIGLSLRARGIEPAIVMAPPHASNQAMHLKYRVVEYMLARAYGWRLLDPWYSAYARATGGWAAGASGDGIHPLWATYQAGGVAMWRQWIGIDQISPLAVMGQQWNGTWGNQIFTSGAAGLATGVQTVGTITPTLESATPDGVIGQWQRATIASQSTAAGFVVNTYADASLVAGDIYYIAAAYKLTGDAQTVLTMGPEWLAGPSKIGSSYVYDKAQRPDVWAGSATAVRRFSMFATAPAGISGATPMRIRMQAEPYSTSTSASLWIGEVQVFNITALLR